MGEQQDLFEQFLPKGEVKHAERLRQVQEGLPPGLYLGTTSWANQDWEGLIYPPGCAGQEYIAHYARVFRAVEIDSTWYRIPSARAVEGWLRRTPTHFRFAAKVPRAITHEKGMVGCEAEIEALVAAMEAMGPRLGPLVMQFEYIARGRDAAEYESGADFLRRLGNFLPKLPVDRMRFAVEVRNGRWMRPELVELLKAHQVALVLNNYYTMPDIAEVVERVDPVTADFLYVRFLGDRRKMEEYVEELRRQGKKKRRWDELVWNRRGEIERWAGYIKQLARRGGMEVYVFFNNHYAGYAPGSLGLFARAWKERQAQPSPRS